MSLNSIPEIIAELNAGRMAVLVDDEDRENEGDLIFAAEFVTPEKVNFMARFGRGLICMPITEAHAERLNLLPMVAHNRSVHGTNFTVSIEAASGVTTGISAADRAHTIKVAASPKATPGDIVQPGHVFPLIAQAGGVLVRAGHTEACCDLAQLAGLYPAAVLCEIMKDDGSMARLPDLIEFSKQHGLKIGSIADLIRYRSQNESLIKRVTERTIHSLRTLPAGRIPGEAFGGDPACPRARRDHARKGDSGSRARTAVRSRLARGRPGDAFVVGGRSARAHRRGRQGRDGAAQLLAERIAADRARRVARPAGNALQDGFPHVRDRSTDPARSQGRKDAPHGLAPQDAQHGWVGA